MIVWVCLLFFFHFIFAPLVNLEVRGLFLKIDVLIIWKQQPTIRFLIWFVCPCVRACCVRPFGDDSSMVVRSAKAGRWAWPSRTTTTGSSWATSPRTGTGTSSTRTLTSLHVSCSKTNRYTIKSHHQNNKRKQNHTHTPVPSTSLEHTNKPTTTTTNNSYRPTDTRFVFEFHLLLSFVSCACVAF